MSLQNTNRNNVRMWEMFLLIPYRDFELSDEHRYIIKRQVDQMLTSITPDVHGPVMVTHNQDDASWHNERRVRVTASNAKSVYAGNSESRYPNLLNGPLCGKSMQTATMLHGNVKAVLARESFQVKIKKEIAGFPVDGTGMRIHGRYPGMGASPDGIVFDPISDTEGVLEIKCHMPLKAIGPNKFDECLTVKRLAAF